MLSIIFHLLSVPSQFCRQGHLFSDIHYLTGENLISEGPTGGIHAKNMEVEQESKDLESGEEDSNRM